MAVVGRWRGMAPRHMLPCGRDPAQRSRRRCLVVFLAPLVLASAGLSLAFVGAFQLPFSVGKQPPRARGAVAAAEAGGEPGPQGAPGEPPPHWIRLVTAVDCVEDADQVAAAVGEVSENLPVGRARVRSFQRRGGEVGEAEEWLLSVSVPPKATLLVSSMIGEALAALSTSKMPMVLAEGLDFEGEPDYYSCEVDITSVLDQSELTDVLAEVVEQRLAACAQVDAAGSRLLFRTTAAGRRALEQWLPSRGVSASSVAWTPVGGNAEYLQWVAQETTRDDEPAA